MLRGKIYVERVIAVWENYFTVLKILVLNWSLLSGEFLN